MNIRFLAASAVVALALSACSSSHLPGPAAGRTVNPSAPGATSPGSGGGTAASAQRSTMSISIAVPAKKSAAGKGRAPKTVSSGTSYVDVVLQSLNGEAQPVDGPYSVLVPLTQLQGCGIPTRGHARAAESVAQCFSVVVPAPVGSDVYAVATLDANMTLLDYVENVPVTVGSGASATLMATLNGVGSGVVGYTMLTDPLNTTSFRLQYGVDCPANAVQYDPKAVCAFNFDVADGSGEDMAVASASSAYLANVVAFTATDVTTGLPLNIGYDTTPPDPSSAVQEIDFDPFNPPGASGGAVLNAGRLGRYSAVIHPDLSEIPTNATDTVEFKAVVSPASTTAFGPNVLLPNSAPAAFTWDLSCRNVTVGADDPAGVAQGSVLQFCRPQESNLSVVVR
jgi:hypothetical protein